MAAQSPLAGVDAQPNAGSGLAPEPEPDSELRIGSESESDADASDDDAHDGREHWTTLEHCGPYFPPEYRPHRPLPRSVRLLYAGDPVELPLEAEEIALAYARVLERPAAQTAGFRANFFADLNAAIVRGGRPALPGLAQCDFGALRAHAVSTPASAKQASAKQASAKQASAKQAKLEARHRWCSVDGQSCETLYFRLDPPGLFFGTKQHAALSGRFVRRVRPDEITLNGSPGLSVAPPYGRWRAVVTDRAALWLAEYEHPVTGLRRMRVAGPRRWDGLQHEHEAAHALGGFLWRVRADYGKDLRSTLTLKREVATALWLADALGLRLGASRTRPRTDIDLGLASLRCTDVVLRAPAAVELRLAGPHNLVFAKTLAVPPVVFANLQLLLAYKHAESPVFSAAGLRAALDRLQQYRRALSAASLRAFSFSRALQLAIDEYEHSVIFKYIPRTHIDRIEVFHQLYRKVAAVMKLLPQVSAARDAQNPLIELHQWVLFRLKMKLHVLNPAFDVGETMDAERYRELGMRYATEVEPRYRANFEIELVQETAPGFVQLATNVTIPNDAAYVWDLVYDRMLLIDLERLRLVAPELATGLLQERLVDPRIMVAYAKRHGLPIPRLVRNTARTRWAYSAPPDFRY